MSCVGETMELGWTYVCASPPLLCSEIQIRAADLGQHVGRGPCWWCRMEGPTPGLVPDLSFQGEVFKLGASSCKS